MRIRLEWVQEMLSDYANLGWAFCDRRMDMKLRRVESWIASSIPSAGHLSNSFLRADQKVTLSSSKRTNSPGRDHRTWPRFVTSLK